MWYPNPKSSYLKAAFLNFISSENKRYNPELTKKRRIRPSKNEPNLYCGACFHFDICQERFLCQSPSFHVSSGLGGNTNKFKLLKKNLFRFYYYL